LHGFTTGLLALAGAFVLLFPPSSTAAQGPCGSWRWGIKTLSDPDASGVNYTPVPKVISELHQLPPPSELKTSTPRLIPFEFGVYRLRARLKEYKREADHDFHVVIADINNSSRTMVAEVVDPACPGARDSVRASAFRAVRQKFIGRFGEPTGSFKLVPGQPVAILIGVGFFDQCGAGHKPRGAAPNCVELHPVLDLEPAP